MYNINIVTILSKIKLLPVFIITGIDLAQLVVKAIILLENADLQVVALTCDGASTNKTMLKILNVTGNKTEFKNYFQNPFNENRKIYVFSDAPHAIKNVRNRLFQNKQSKVNNQ